VAHTHGGDEHGHDHHGGGRGLAWELLDSIMLGCFVIVAWLLAEQAYRWWRARTQGVRYDLTPAGRAVTEPVGTEPGCSHPECKLDHPHAGPAILRSE
jgi:hypothetical protein